MSNIQESMLTEGNKDDVTDIVHEFYKLAKQCGINIPQNYMRECIEDIMVFYEQYLKHFNSKFCSIDFYKIASFLQRTRCIDCTVLYRICQYDFKTFFFSFSFCKFLSFSTPVRYACLTAPRPPFPAAGGSPPGPGGTPRRRARPAGRAGRCGRPRSRPAAGPPGSRTGAPRRRRRRRETWGNG